MKKFIKFLMFALIGVLLISTAITATSCDRVRDRALPDSIFENKVDSYLPIAMQKMYEFDNPVDVILYKQERLRQLEADSIITGLSDQTLSNICTVLGKQQKTYGISDIVYEYQSNKRIYGALPEAPAAPPISPTGRDSTDSIIPYNSLQL